MARQWVVIVTSVLMLLAATPAALAQTAQPQVRQVSTTTAGPWTVIGWKAGENISYCTAERDVGTIKVAFIRVQQGWGLLLHSPSWQFDPSNPVPVQVARRLGQTSLSGRAITANIVLVPVDDNLLRYIAEQTQIEVTAAGTTITIPLDSIANALTALRDCIVQVHAPQQTPGAPGAAPASLPQHRGPAKPGSVNAPRPPGRIQVPSNRVG